MEASTSTQHRGNAVPKETDNVFFLELDPVQSG